MQKLAKAMFKKTNHVLDVVGTGAEAVKAVSKNIYDLIFMDVKMPDMDGLEASRRIRKIPGEKGKIPIIALSAYAMPEQSRTYNGIRW